MNQETKYKKERKEMSRCREKEQKTGFLKFKLEKEECLSVGTKSKMN